MNLDELAVKVTQARLAKIEAYVGSFVRVCTQDDCYDGCLVEVDPESLSVTVRNPFKGVTVIIMDAITEVGIYGRCPSDDGA